MSKVRATIVLEKYIAEEVRQMFGGNLSKGVNTLLAKQLERKKTDDSGFGLLKGHGPALKAALRKLREDDQVD